MKKYCKTKNASANKEASPKISLIEPNCNYLRSLWYDKDGSIAIYGHKR